ncbi:DUF2304 domain-containing protein [Aurantimicrobium minutum]|uniref:DUF2304 domain-containing protein n=1 Tax=Aurantimicrobium minutum TaxID=708131 RepID=UPI000BBAF304
MWVQIALILALIFVLVYLVRSKPSAKQLAIGRLVIIFAVICGVVVIIAPGVLTSFANFLGVGRGTDLLVYVLIIAFLINAVSNYKKNIETSRKITKLARAVCLENQHLRDEISKHTASKSD